MPVVHVVTNDILVDRFTSALGGQTGVNVKFSKCLSHTGVGATIAEVAQAFDTFYATNVKPLLTGPATYIGSRHILYRIGQLVASEINAAHGGAGTAGTAPLPTQVRGLVTLRTSYAGRNQRGRLYLPFPDQTAQTPPAEAPNLAYQALQGTLAFLFTIQHTVVGAGGNSVTAFGNPKFAVPPNPKRPLDIQDFFETYTLPGLWATQRRSGDYGRVNPPTP